MWLAGICLPRPSKETLPLQTRWRRWLFLVGLSLLLEMSTLLRKLMWSLLYMTCICFFWSCSYLYNNKLCIHWEICHLVTEIIQAFLLIKLNKLINLYKNYKCFFIISIELLWCLIFICIYSLFLDDFVLILLSSSASSITLT